MKKILIPLPSRDSDPTETSVPWKILRSHGISVCFATPEGKAAECDPRILKGTGLGPLASLLAADRNAHKAYQEMCRSPEFQAPIRWDGIVAQEFDGIILPGGHAKGMREYLESPVLHDEVRKFFEADRPVGAICHGVVLAARTRSSSGKSLLFGRKTTALLASQELAAWALTCLWLGDYYRTYEQTVEAEVRSQLASGEDFIRGPLPLLRDTPEALERGFTVRDGNYLSARWPGDAHCFGMAFLRMIQ